MIATIALVLLSFVFLIRRAYRRAGQSGGYHPEGKLRWTDETAP